MKKSVNWIIKHVGVSMIVMLLVLLFAPLTRAPLPAEHWDKPQFDRVYPGLHKTVEAYSFRLLKQDIIPNKRIVMKCAESNMRQSLLGISKFGKTHTFTVIVGYIRDGDAEAIFPSSQIEHVITKENAEAFSAWLRRTIEETNSQPSAPGDSATRADGAASGMPEQ